MENDSHTAERKAWIQRQRKRVEPSPEQHVLTRREYTPSYKTDIGKRIRAEQRRLKAAA